MFASTLDTSLSVFGLEGFDLGERLFAGLPSFGLDGGLFEKNLDLLLAGDVGFLGGRGGALF